MAELLRWTVRVIARVVAVSGQRAVAMAEPTGTPQATFNVLRQSWIGTWSCAKSVTNTKTVRWAETATAYGDKWIKFTGVYPAEKATPASAYESLFGYDSERHQWVTVTFIADGTYGIDKGTSGQNATIVTWVNAYPVEPHVPATQVLSKRGFTVSGTYTEAGKPIFFHWNCAKR